MIWNQIIMGIMPCMINPGIMMVGTATFYDGSYDDGPNPDAENDETDE